MKTKTINLYEYDELPEDIKAKVLENHRYINVDDSWWSKAELDYWKEELKAEGFEDAKIAFSGFWSQGDGASFTATVNIETFLRKHRSITRFKKLLPLIPMGDLSACVVRVGHHHVHENTVKADVEMAWNNETEPLEGLRGELEGFLTERVRELSRKIYKSLESDYRFQTSDEAIIETLKANEYTFREDGKVERE